MHCPYCQNTLNTITTATKADIASEIGECLNCGGHWFPRWLANDITLSEAKNIDAVVPKTEVSIPSEPRCPVCQYRLSMIQGEAVVRGTTVWACPQGHGNFFPVHNLFNFKSAQEAKISYHQIWGIPIKSVFAVLLPVIAVIAVAAGTPVAVQLLNTSQETRTQASAIIKPPIVTPTSPTSVIISFTSSQILTTEITIYQGQNVITVVPVSTTAKTVHTVTINDLPGPGDFTFVIKYTNSAGQSNLTHSYPLSLK